MKTIFRVTKLLEVEFTVAIEGDEEQADETISQWAGSVVAVIDDVEQLPGDLLALATETAGHSTQVEILERIDDKGNAMNRLPRDHPEVIELHRQLQERHKNIGRVSVLVGMVHVDNLRTELWERGWNTKLADDQLTVVLLEREEEHGKV